jgi:hypothetical protein
MNTLFGARGPVEKESTQTTVHVEDSPTPAWDSRRFFAVTKVPQ